MLFSEKKHILRNVSGTFHKKQACAIIGCSGSGKSSLLNFISGYKYDQTNLLFICQLI